MRAFLAATSAAAVALAFAAAPASADCYGGHKQVTASVAQPKDTKVVMNTYDPARPVLNAAKIQTKSVAAAAPCAAGEKDCKAGTE